MLGESKRYVWFVLNSDIPISEGLLLAPTSSEQTTEVREQFIQPRNGEDLFGSSKCSPLKSVSQH